MQLDRRWHSLLACQTDNQMQFRLLTTEDHFPTPSRLHMWGVGDGMCPLGCKAKGSLLHILTVCRMEEEPQSRITWRHDSVLFAIFRAVLGVTNRFKKAHQQAVGVTEPVSSAIQFRSEANTKYPAVRVPVQEKVLAGAVDWQLQFDMTVPSHGQSKERPFPPEILPTSGKRPDAVIWSLSIKTVIWIELTSPWEDNMTLRHAEKKARYNQLKIDCEALGWKVHPLCVEVGCRGHVAQSYNWMCSVLGFTKEEQRQLKWELERTAEHCSHAIVVARYQRVWEPKPLLDVSRWQ